METDNRGQKILEKKSKKPIYLKQTNKKCQAKEQQQKLWSAVLIKNKREKTQNDKTKE